MENTYTDLQSYAEPRNEYQVPTMSAPASNPDSPKLAGKWLQKSDSVIIIFLIVATIANFLLVLVLGASLSYFLLKQDGSGESLESLGL